MKAKGIKYVSCRRNPGSKLVRAGTSLVVQCLRVYTFTSGCSYLREEGRVTQIQGPLRVGAKAVRLLGKKCP